jgi:hypothetical protein
MNYSQRRRVRLTIIGILLCALAVYFFFWHIQSLEHTHGY